MQKGTRQLGTEFALCTGIADLEPVPVEVRLLKTLQDLMALPALELGDALMAATQCLARTLSCDKVDVFLLDEEKHMLRAIGTSDTPMGRKQKALGLDLLAIANGGRSVQVFREGKSHLGADAERDPEELRGIVVDLGVRSSLSAPLEVDGVRRGVVSAVSRHPRFFDTKDLNFLEIVAQWVGMLTHRAELVEQARRAESNHARREAADEIVTVVAHDLRNHLHPLLGRLQLMRRKLANGDAIGLAELEAAVRSVQRLSHLTSDLLDVARLDQGLFALNLEPVDLMAIALETSSLATAAVPVQVSGAGALVVIADADRLRQALENIVANAVKHSPPGKAVRVVVSVVGAPDPARAVVEIEDEGPGIPPELLPRLFERFTAGRDSKGLGLGLYLAYRVALAHGGELRASSVPGTGTRFRFELPVDGIPDSRGE